MARFALLEDYTGFRQAGNRAGQFIRWNTSRLGYVDPFVGVTNGQRLPVWSFDNNQFQTEQDGTYEYVAAGAKTFSVLVDSYGDVIEVDVSNDGVTGLVPNTYGLLPNLQKLQLNDNNYTGIVSGCFDALTLTDVNLHGNSFSQVVVDSVIAEFQGNVYSGGLGKTLNIANGNSDPSGYVGVEGLQENDGWNVDYYSPNDTFTTAFASGALDGTPVDGSVGTRTVTETTNLLNTSGGALQFSTAGPTSSRYNLRGIPRQLGRGFITSLTPTGTFDLVVGFSATDGGSIGTASLHFDTTGVYYGSKTAQSRVADALSSGTSYDIAVVPRAIGTAYFILGGAYTTWTLLFIDNVNTDSTLHLALEFLDGTVTVSHVRTFVNSWYISPVISDNFNYSFGRTDGMGHVEQTGIGSGGQGVEWSNNGEWDVRLSDVVATTTGPANNHTFTYYDAGTTDVYFSSKLDRQNGAVGVVIYVDDNNYLYINTNGSNLRLQQRLAGSISTLNDVPITYVTNGEVVYKHFNNQYFVYYEGELIFTGVLAAPFNTATNFGCWSNNVNNAIDNFVLYLIDGHSIVEAGYEPSTNVVVTATPLTITNTTYNGTWVHYTNTGTDSRAINEANALFSTVFDAMDIHTRFFGVSDMQPNAPATLPAFNPTPEVDINFATDMDVYMAAIKAGGINQVSLRAWGMPEYMLAANPAPSIDNPPESSMLIHYAAFVVGILRRYNLDTSGLYPTIYQVEVGHEGKGFSGGVDFAFMAQFYDAIYDAVKAFDSSILMLAPYLVMKGSGANNVLNEPSTTETREPLEANTKANVEGFFASVTRPIDRMAIDVKPTHFSEATPTYDDMQLLYDYWPVKFDESRGVVGYTGQELVSSESYAININVVNNFSNRQQAIAQAVMLYYSIIKNVATVHFWGPESQAPNNRLGLWASTSNDADIELYHTYFVQKLMRDNYASGTQLFQVDMDGDTRNLYIISDGTNTTLINARSEKRKVTIGGVTHSLHPYEVRHLS